MRKNVYSLVLLDSVVDAVDQLACERNTSRSGLINQILAEYLSCPIPEDKMRDIFSLMENRLSDLRDFNSNWQQGESMFYIRSPLHYRYRPTVRYALELYRESTPYFGETRVSFRTQNGDLLKLSEAFFRFWETLENKWIGSRFPEGKVPSTAGPGRYTRKLSCPQSESDRTSERTADAILAYLGEFDADLKEFFSGTEMPEETVRKIETHYLRFLKDAIIL